jgi:hypothetical protein
MDRTEFDRMAHELRDALRSAPDGHRFPLNAAVTGVLTQVAARKAAAAAKPEVSDDALGLLAIFDATAVSAAVALKQISETHDDRTGLTTALVDLWGQAEAARCLWFDKYRVFTGEDSQLREEALKETARLLAPEAIALAMRLQEPVAQYVEFVSKVVP